MSDPQPFRSLELLPRVPRESSPSNWPFEAHCLIIGSIVLYSSTAIAPFVRYDTRWVAIGCFLVLVTLGIILGRESRERLRESWWSIPLFMFPLWLLSLGFAWKWVQLPGPISGYLLLAGSALLLGGYRIEWIRGPRP